MDPNDWLSMPEIQSIRDWASVHDSATALTVMSNEGVLHRPIGLGPKVLVRDGDLRVMLDSTGLNRSASHNLGFNLAAKHFTYNHRLYSLGGRGFWNAHAKLIEFIEKTGEWELVSMAEGPQCVTVRGTCFDVQQGVLYAIEEGDWGRTAERQDVVWRLGLEDLQWDRIGTVNPRLQIFSRGFGQLHDLEEFTLWLGSHQTAILRKSDGQAVLTDQWNQREFGLAMAQMRQAEMSMLAVEGNRLKGFTRDKGGGEAMIFEWDAEKAFAGASSQSALMDWVLPYDDAKGMTSDAMTTEARESGESQSSGSLWVLVALGLGLAVAAFLLGKQSAPVNSEALDVLQSETTEPMGGLEDRKDVAPSAAAILHLIQELEQLGARIMSTEEVNQFLDLGEEVSSESKRAKRAQFIRDVNRVYQMRHGKNMIVRERDLNDRRRTIYVIHPRSGTA